MKKAVLSLTICLFFTALAFAQDPPDRPRILPLGPGDVVSHVEVGKIETTGRVAGTAVFVSNTGNTPFFFQAFFFNNLGKPIGRKIFGPLKPNQTRPFGVREKATWAVQVFGTDLAARVMRATALALTVSWARLRALAGAAASAFRRATIPSPCFTSSLIELALRSCA